MDGMATVSWRNGNPSDGGRGRVSLVGAGPGAVDLITQRAIDRLQSADIVYYDRLVDPKLLTYAPKRAKRVYVGKHPGGFAWPQDRINACLVASALAGLKVVRLKGGDPGVFGRGAEEADALDAHGIAWEIVPGVTAATAAAAAAGTFLTRRGETEAVLLATGRLADETEEPGWDALVRPGTTLALYMGVAAADCLAARLIARGLSGDTEVQVVCSAACPGERILTSDLASLGKTLRQEQVVNQALILIKNAHSANAPIPVPCPEAG